MKKAGLIISVAALLIVSMAIVNGTADATKVSSYQFPNLVVEINRVVTILNSVLDSSNNIDATKVSGAIDVDSVTVDAGAGMDNQAAGSLLVGAATATKVEIADAAVETEVQGPLDVQGNADFDGKVTLNATAASWTNGQAVTVAAGAYTISGVGGANDTTNTITLVAPAAAGDLVYLMMATATTNLITIADSTTVAASGAILLDANDTAVLMAVDASTWCLVSESDN